MVLRPLSIVRRSLAVAAIAAVGCSSNAPAPKPVAAMPTFQSPSLIRPNDSAFKLAPLPADPTPVASAAPLPRPTGEWAPPVAPRAWRYIVIHHSASPSGNAALFDQEHRAKGWDELGYHFVIDNGRGGPDGNVEIGPRWEKQKWGAHDRTPDNRYNDFGIGICFVGNFQDARPTAKQMASAAKLVAFLMETYRIPAENVVGHGDTKQTLCPGRNMSVASIRTLAERAIADAGFKTPAETTIPSLDASGVPPLLARATVDHELLRTR